MKTFEVEKLYHNHASIRDYMVKECIQKQEGLIVVYQGEKMTLSVADLQRQFQFHQQNFRSKFNSRQKYQLVDFFFMPDEQEPFPCNLQS